MGELAASVTRYRYRRALGVRGGNKVFGTTTAIATCRSTSSAAGSCSAPSCAPPTSTGPPARSKVARIGHPGPLAEGADRAGGDSCREELMAWCEAEGVAYLFGLAPNARLKAVTGARGLGSAVVPNHRQGGSAVQGFRLPDRDLLERPRRVVGKAEHLPDGANPRFVVTRGREKIDARGLYEDPIAPAARWKTASSASSTCSPTARRRRPCRPTNCACGSRRGLRASPSCAGSRSATPSLPMPPAAPSGLLKIGALVRRSFKFAMASGFPWQTEFPQIINLAPAARWTPCPPVAFRQLSNLAPPLAVSAVSSFVPV